MPPSKQPNDGGGAEFSKIYLRDKLLEVQLPIVTRENKDLFVEKFFKIEWDDGDQLKPQSYIDNGLLEEM